MQCPNATDRSEHAVVTSSLAAYDAFFGSRPNSLFAHILQTFMRPKGSSYISSPPSFILSTQSTSPATLNMKTSFAILAAAVSFVSASVIVIDTDAHAQVDVDLNTRTTGCRQCMCRSSSNSIIIRDSARYLVCADAGEQCRTRGLPRQLCDVVRGQCAHECHETESLPTDSWWTDDKCQASESQRHLS